MVSQTSDPFLYLEHVSLWTAVAARGQSPNGFKRLVFLGVGARMHGAGEAFHSTLRSANIHLENFRYEVK